ncbi:hypothetical protein [Helicobacter bilis]|uniref:LPD3 domain-containing protein n=1 Tax=Helicobacter bilis TaxID=37372 RepID=UPI0010FEC033|nr:hypothetical protein [Helicobacter bilis]TLE07306.1 hypothetical protein LS78_009995 [Helicobacter bilis]
MQNPHVEPQGETSHLNEKIDSNFTYTTQETKGIKVLRNDLIGVLSPYKTQPITNKETGMQGFITTNEINKISSKKAIDKSIANGFSRDEHFKVAQDLKSLFENSKLKESHADNKQREHIKVHRFIQDLSINDKEAQAKITLFEKIEGKNRIYTLELEGLDKPDSLSVSMRNAESAVKAQSVATAHPETTTIAKTDTDIIPQNLPEVYKNMLDEIDKQAKQDYKTSIDNLQNALNDTDFKATLLQGYKQVTDDAIESLGLDNQLTNTLIRETQKLESKPNISLAQAIELRKNINEIMRNYEKSSSDLKKFRANKHLDNIKDNIDNAIKNALDSKVAQNEAHLGRNVESKDVSLSESKHLNKEVIETFIDSKGNTQEITKEVAQTWMNTFGLKSINDEAVVNVAKEVRQAIGKDIKVNRKDLEKLIENHREQYIPQIKETFETPHVAFIDEKSDLLMGISLDDKLFFVNVSRDYGKDFLNVTLSPKKNNNLLNKLQNAKQVIIDYPPNFGIPQPNQASTGFLSSTSMGSKHNPTQKTLTRQEADELFSNFQQANKNYAQIKESLNDKFAKALTKGMNKKDLDSRLTIEQWKQRVLDTQWGDSVKGLENTIFKNFNPRMHLTYCYEFSLMRYI